MKTGFLNRTLRSLCREEYRKFVGCHDIKRVQTEYLTNILRKNSNTEYGKKYGFSEIKNYNEFAEKVPLSSYEDYEPFIQKIADGEKRILTCEDVILFEPTSGSSGGRKLIPYTKTLQAEFQRGIRPWLCDIYTNVKGACDGKSYWSITPVTDGKSFTKAGIPIGFEEDSAYFGKLEQAVMERLFAVDGSVKFSGSMREFYFNTAVGLLSCGALSLISVWNPTFLTILCGFISENREELSKKIPENKRKNFLNYAKEKRFEKIFPDLKIISCWADGSAADDVKEIQRLFSGVYIQPKGLLATECFTSFPLVGEDGSRLSVRSHFFEFRRLSDGKIFTADELSTEEYELIVTTGGGFYRYCTGDIIKVLEACPDAPPRIRFMRRSGICSDLCGEKLTEEFVRNVCAELGITDKFCLLAPEGKRYILYTNAESISDEALDSALRENYHYNYCRELGQLQQAGVCRVFNDPERVYLERLSSEGMRLGDIKPAYLSLKSGWTDIFDTERKK